MRHSLLKVLLSTVLLLLAGLVSAYQSVPTIAPEPCHDMAMDEMHPDHHSTNDETVNSLSDCDSQCNCCPGSCSSVFTVASNSSLNSIALNRASSDYLLASQQAALFDFLRPPISA